VNDGWNGYSTKSRPRLGEGQLPRHPEDRRGRVGDRLDRHPVSRRPEPSLDLGHRYRHPDAGVRRRRPRQGPRRLHEAVQGRLDKVRRRRGEADGISGRKAQTRMITDKVENGEDQTPIVGGRAPPPGPSPGPKWRRKSMIAPICGFNKSYVLCHPSIACAASLPFCKSDQIRL
jgi:hypothetical protein